MLPNHKRNHTHRDGSWTNLEQRICHFLIQWSIIGRLAGTTSRWVRISQIKSHVTVFKHSQTNNVCGTISFFLVWVRVTVHTIEHHLIAGKRWEVFPFNISQNACPRNCKYIIVANTHKYNYFSTYFTPTWCILQWTTVPEFSDRLHPNELKHFWCSVPFILHFYMFAIYSHVECRSQTHTIEPRFHLVLPCDVPVLHSFGTDRSVLA